MPFNSGFRKPSEREKRSNDKGRDHGSNPQEMRNQSSSPADRPGMPQMSRPQGPSSSRPLPPKGPSSSRPLPPQGPSASRSLPPQGPSASRHIQPREDCPPMPPSQPPFPSDRTPEVYRNYNGSYGSQKMRRSSSGLVGSLVGSALSGILNEVTSGLETDRETKKAAVEYTDSAENLEEQTLAAAQKRCQDPDYPKFCPNCGAATTGRDICEYCDSRL